MRCLLSMLVCLVWGGACAFDTSTVGTGSDDGGNPVDATPVETVDAKTPPDAWQSCEPKSRSCSGDTIQTCNEGGTGADMTMVVNCDFTCVDDGGPQCVEASNVDSAAELCKDNYKPLVAGDQAEVMFTAPGPGLEVIACVGLCGGLLQAIAPVATGGDYAIFCLSDLEVAQTATIEFTEYAGREVVLIVEGAVDVQGDFDFSGTGSSQGPGGGQGGLINGGVTPHDGVGACPGLGGATDDANDGTDYVGGGGGGAGNEGRGGHGRRGRGYDNNNVAQGDRGEGNNCSNSDLIPLVGGSGGGSGGDGKCGGACGWPGGGGGGAIQISSKTSITIGGTLEASGANGLYVAGSAHGGGGGGGSGGGILLEAPIIEISGRLEVEGGDGGSSPTKVGGPGAKDGENEGMQGENLANNDRGGGVGGGGGGGRVRLNGIQTPNCGDLGGSISPVAACSTGAMLTP